MYAEPVILELWVHKVQGFIQLLWDQIKTANEHRLILLARNSIPEGQHLVFLAASTGHRDTLRYTES